MRGLWPRLGAVSGLLMVPLSFGGFVLIGSGGFAAQPGASVDEVVKIVSAPAPPQVFFGLYLDSLGTLMLVAFASRLWATLRQAEGSPAWISAAAFGAALLAAAASFGDKIAFHAIFARAGAGLDARVATSLYDITAGGFALFGLFFAAFAGLSAIVIVSTRTLPSWLGWLGAVVALVGVVGSAPGLRDFGQIAFPLSLIWALAMSVTLLLRRDV